MTIELVKSFCLELKKLGHQSFIYGDTVRSLYFKIPMVGKYDVVTESPKEIFENLLKDKKYEPIKDCVDIDNFRSDYKLQFTSGNMSITPNKEDSPIEGKLFKHLQTLDFTIDMMFMSNSGGNSITYNSKIKSDIKNKIIRYNKPPKSGVFNNPLSIVKACVIASTIGGTIESKTLLAMKEYLSLLRFIYKTDVKYEIAKAILRIKNFSKFIEYIDQVGLRSYIFPYLHLSEFSKELGDSINLNRPQLKIVCYYYDAFIADVDNSYVLKSYFEKTYVVSKLLNLIKMLKNDEEFTPTFLNSICFGLKHPSDFSKGDLVTIMQATCKLLNKPFPKDIMRKIFKTFKTDKAYQSHVYRGATV